MGGFLGIRSRKPRRSSSGDDAVGPRGARTLFPMVNPPPPARKWKCERRAGEGDGDGEGLGAESTTRGSGAPPSEDRVGRRYVDLYPGDRLGGDADEGRRAVARDVTGDGDADANAAATIRSKEPSSDEGEDEPSRSRSLSTVARGRDGSTRSSSSSESSKSLESDDGVGDGMPFAPTHGGREGLRGGVEVMGVAAGLPGLALGSRGGTRAGLAFGPAPGRRRAREPGPRPGRVGCVEASAGDAHARARSRVAASRLGATNVRPKAMARGAGSRRAGEGSRERERAPARTPRSLSSRLDVVAAGARNRNASSSRSRASASASRATARALDPLAARDAFRRCIGVVEPSRAFPGESAFPRSRRLIPGDDVVRESEIRSAPIRASRHSRRRHRVLDALYRRVAPVRSSPRACQPPRAPRMCRDAARHTARVMLAPSVGPKQ